MTGFILCRPRCGYTATVMIEGHSTFAVSEV